MEKNDQHSLEDTPQEKLGNPERHQSYGEYRMGEFRSPCDPKTPRKLKKQSRKTTAIALGILMLASLGLVGFEAVATKAPDAVNPSLQASRSLLILSQERERENAGLLSSLNFENSGDADSAALQEANRLQSAKINALKRQLVEANQRLHEVKSHLFSKGDPSDRARLAEICQELVEKERNNHDLKEKLSKLENENEQTLQKMRRMEHTIDALATMTDTQRESKEQAILNFQNQLDQLRTDANQERNDLQLMIADLTREQQQLRETLAEKLATVKNLDSEVTLQYAMLEEKEKEIQSQAQLYTNAEKNLNEQLQDLIASMELELLSSHNLRSDYNVAQARLSAQQSYTKTMEERLHAADLKTKFEMDRVSDMQLALAREYLDLEGMLAVYATTHSQLEGKHKKLAQLVKDEKEKALLLEKNLHEALAAADAEQQRGFCLEEELHKATQQVTILTTELSTQEHLLNSKQHEFETMAYSHASLKDQLNERIKQLVANLEEEQMRGSQKDRSIHDLAITLELEKTRSQELDHHLQQSIETTESLTKHFMALEDELNHKAETIAALEDRLQDKQQEINSMSNQMAQLSETLEEERLRTRELHQALVTALEKNENDISYINHLKEEMSENADTLTLIQDRMTDKKKEIDEMGELIAELSQDLEYEKIKNLDLLKELAVASAETDSSHNRASALEAEIVSNNRKIISLQDSLADKQQEVRDLLAKFQDFSSLLDAEKTRADDLEYELNITNEKHYSEYNTAKDLEQNIENHQKKIASLLKQLNEISDNYDVEKMKSTELEKNLFKVMSKLDQKEQILDQKDQILDQILSDNKVTDEELSVLRKEVEMIIRERDAYAKENEHLAKKNEQQMKLLLQQQEIMQKLSGDVKAREEAMRQLEESKDEIQNQVEVSELYRENGTPEGTTVAREVSTHTVRHGETLSTISTLYYGTPNLWAEIFYANTDILKSKNEPLQKGMVLRIP